MKLCVSYSIFNACIFKKMRALLLNLKCIPAILSGVSFVCRMNEFDLDPICSQFGVLTGHICQFTHLLEPQAIAGNLLFSHSIHTTSK